jgi:hypothetical protein
LSEPKKVLKSAIKVGPQKLNIAGRASADINHGEFFSVRGARLNARLTPLHV